MLVLRLLVMVLTIICLMDGHAEVSSTTTGIRDRRESPAVKTNEQEVEILDRKKKKKPKPSKKKKPKPGKKKKPKNKKPVTTAPTVSTSTLKTTTILTTPTVTTTVTTTTTTVSPTTTATTTKTTTSTASATTTLSTTTSATTTAKTTTVATSSTTSTTTIPTTVTTSSPPTTAATTADSGAGGECKATNGKPCIFPFKDGKEYNECKNEGGKYFWCATSVYDSGKYKHWSYCSTDGPCPLEGDGECRATNNKPCVFPFKDGNKEYNECADHGGKYFWCATGTNSAGKYTAWSECPKDGSCPLPQKGTTSTSSTTTTASTHPPTNDTSAAAGAIANVENALAEINDTLQNLETAGFSEDEKQLLETMNDLSDYMESGSQTRNWNFYDAVKINSITQQLYSSTAKIKATKQVNPGFKSKHQSADATCSVSIQNAKLYQANAGPGRMFQLHTISKILGIVTNIPSSSACCAECKIKATDSELFEHSNYYKECYCFKTKSGVTPQTTSSITIDSGVCPDEEGTCQLTRGLKCPNGYKDNGKSPMEFKELQLPTDIAIDDREKCGQACKAHTTGKCIALIWICAETKCQLFADKDEATTTTMSIKKNNYCLDLKYSDDCPKDLMKPAENLMCKCLPTVSLSIDPIFCYEGNYCLRTLRSSKCLPDCKKVSDSDSTVPSDKECVCNKQICKDGYFCNTSQDPNTCHSGEKMCTDTWKDKYQGYRPSSGSIQSRVVGAPNFGSKVDKTSRWPWMAMVTVEHGLLSGKGICGGVLITCEHVMTALHCIADSDKLAEKPYPIKKIKIWLNSLDGETGSKFSVRSLRWVGGDAPVMNGPIKYKKTSSTKPNIRPSVRDYAVIRLERPINPYLKSDIGIRPIKLPEKKLELDDTIWFAGFGYSSYLVDNTPGGRGLLYETSHLQVTEITDLNVKLTGTKDVHLMKGDSGSPGMVEGNGNQWFLQVINSAGSGTNTIDKPVNEGVNVYYLKSISMLDKDNFLVKYDDSDLQSDGFSLKPATNIK